MHKHEQRILEALCNNLSAAGFKPAAVYSDGMCIMLDDKSELIETHGTRKRAIPMTTAQVISVFAAYDMYCPTIHFTHKDLTTWGNRDVMVAEGNLCDFICDWHCGDKTFDAIVGEVATAASEGMFE